MKTEPWKPAVEIGNDGRGDCGARPERPRWARPLRRVLLGLIGLLYAASIPWYRGDAPPARIFGLPDWVAVAAALMIGMALLAIGARDVTLWGVIELKMELLIQCVPVFLIAIHWSRLRAQPALLGFAFGVRIAIAGVALDSKRVFGVHIGVIGLAGNAAIACIGSLFRSPGSPPHRALPLQ